MGAVKPQVVNIDLDVLKAMLGEQAFTILLLRSENARLEAQAGSFSQEAEGPEAG